ncbi:methyl-accepting chemotaxis protein [Pengzhenrongella phosphoraccumulans]|uniref:methyl-accepting chemotaxis protein n=1 Tax=Pengzhenrongella phosphoraccumulans TaxID=3114394 RepID=UPI00388F1EEC
MLGVRARFFGSYALIILLLAVAVTIGLAGVRAIEGQTQVITGHAVPYLTHLADASVAAKAAADDERGFLLTDDPAFTTEFDARLTTVQAALDGAAASAADDAQRLAVEEIAAGFATWTALVHDEFALQASDPTAAVDVALGANRDARKGYEAAIGAAVEQASQALAVTISDQEAAAGQVQRTLLGLLVGAVAVAVAIAVWMTRQVTVPLHQMQVLVTTAAAGDLTGRTTLRSKDEFGALGGALNRMFDSLGGVLTTIAGSAASLSAATEELNLASTQIATSAEESAVRANVVAAAAEQVSTNVQTVAAGTEQMSASIREIAKNTNDAASVAAMAVRVAKEANDTVSQLGQSSAEIGGVIKVINSIAEQTNLLALNATIEAARAGEAGKGFAVVASEVKDLARETSRATEDISNRIETIQSETTAAVAAIIQIVEIIEQINDTQATIASAVEEQTATTNEMSRNVHEAALGSTEIASNIVGVAESAAMTTDGVTHTLQASADLSQMSTDLTELVAQFTFARGRGDDDASRSIEEQLTRAIGAHGTWKKKLTTAIAAGSSNHDVATVALDDRCDFGRWLHGSVPAEGSTAHHRTSVRLHAGFHREAAAVLRLVSGGGQAEARASMAAGGDFAEASRLLTSAMVDWRQAVAAPAPVGR